MSFAPHPEPPADLNDRALPIEKRRGPWFRSYSLAYDPVYFARAPEKNRFDDPNREFGVLYCAVDAHAAFIETFGHTTGIKAVTLQELKVRGLAELATKKTLRLVSLLGSGLARIGADARLATGDYQLAQRWSRALHEHPDRPDGILYPSRHDVSRTCVAIFGPRAVACTPRGSWAAPENAKLLGAILDHYQFGLMV